ENNWTTANKVRPLPTPQPSGTRQERTVSALTPGITYFFAIKTADNLPSWSDISNVVTAFTGESTPTLTVDFASSTLSGAAPLEVSFSSDVSGEPTSWLWDFGDGSQSLEENPTHVYDASGSFTVTLTVASGSVSASETKADYIVVIEPEQEDALHVSRLVTSRKQYKIWCRGYADVYVVNSLGQPVEGATVALAASGATSEALSAVTDGLGVASFKTRVSRNCSKDWCFAVTDVSHPQLPYDAPSDVVNSTCYTVATYAGRAEFDWDGVEMPIDFSLEQNYPNPFNPSTEITYSLPAPSQVRLVVINMLGQEVVTLVEGQQSAGWHSTTWDGRSAGGKAVASGLYFYHLQAGEFSESRKMMLLK
ncbi:MAG: PKD domain-containing protein, partial [bacterium]|nr:PKD domain-containing protein [bacterium]